MTAIIETPGLSPAGRSRLLELLAAYGDAKFRAGRACGTGASPDWDAIDTARDALFDWMFAVAAVVPRCVFCGCPLTPTYQDGSGWSDDRRFDGPHCLATDCPVSDDELHHPAVA